MGEYFIITVEHIKKSPGILTVVKKLIALI